MVRLLAREVVVIPEDVEAGPSMSQDVVLESHMVDLRPRGCPILVPHGEEDREAALGVRPIVLEHVSFDGHPAGVLQFEEVLHAPMRPCIGWVVDLPGQRLEEVVVPHDDV